MLNNRITVMAVGVNNYDYLTKLNGSIKDVENLEKLLCHDQTAVLEEDSFIKLLDIDIEELRRRITDYALDRTAPHDILIFYFSGHGIPIGNRDLGFCLKNSNMHSEFSTAIPLNVIRFSDLVETLSAVNVDPIIIIDACYSSQAGEKIELILSELKREIQAETGSNYALLCSSKKHETSTDTISGGLFSSILFEVAQDGMNDSVCLRKEELTLKDLYSKIREKIEANCFDISPQLYVGDTLPDFGFVKNIKFKPLNTVFNSGFKDALNAFWNNGHPKELSTVDLQPLGSTVHTTYSKLSYSPGWELLEKTSRGKAKLTDKGKKFIRGEITIPYSITKNPETDAWHKTQGTKNIKYDDY